MQALKKHGRKFGLKVCSEPGHAWAVVLCSLYNTVIIIITYSFVYFLPVLLLSFFTFSLFFHFLGKLETSYCPLFAEVWIGRLLALENRRGYVREDLGVGWDSVKS